MASLLKNQIFKHLSKFTKGLSADKINLSTFKGEGELSNLELNETVLTDLLELPFWLKITSACCKKVTFRVQWTQLKSVPIHLNLEEVLVTVETCEELRTTSCVQGLSSYAGAAHYGFIYKVIDGVTITIDTVKITFISPAFMANIELSRIIVQSKSRDWEDCKLTASRIKDSVRGQVLLFKEIEWNDARIEAKSTKDPNLTPLRLITNKARCRITLKKKLLDSSIMGSRLAILLDDLLWVLTDFQLKAALHFLDSLAGLIEKVTKFTKKKKAARKLETLPEYQAQQSQSSKTNELLSPMSKLFERYDVVETSYHFQAQKIELHFSDDPSAGRSCHPELKGGGAFQVTLKKFKMDYYPYHLAIADRYHWASYNTSALQWLKQSEAHYTTSLLGMINDLQWPVNDLSQDILNQLKNDNNSEAFKQQNNSFESKISKKINTLMTSCFMIRILDFDMYQVTTSCSKKRIHKEFISAAKKDRLGLESLVHAEFTNYYFPGDDPFPLPAPKLYVQLYPIQINFDVITVLWLNAFILNLHQSLLQMKTNQSSSASDFMCFDVHMEAIEPRVIMESLNDYPGQKDRPKSLHFKVSRARITNTCSVDQSFRADLKKSLYMFQMCSLFFNQDFPSETKDFSLVSQKFFDYFNASNAVHAFPSSLASADASYLKNNLSREILWTGNKNIWSVQLDPFFADFFGAQAVGKDYPVHFLDAFPLTLWVSVNLPANANSTPTTEEKSNSNGSTERSATIHLLTYISSLVSIQINHYQYLFLLRLLEEVKELATYLGIDGNRITKFVNSSLVIGGIIPELDITFVMPAQSPGKESSGGDVESVIPDSSSLQDDGTPHWHLTGSAVNVNNSFLDGCQLSISDYPVNIPKTSIDQAIKNKAVNGNVKPTYPSFGNKSLSLDSSSQAQKKPFYFLSSSLKKGFDKILTSIDTSAKTSPDDISDNISEKSNLSSDGDAISIVNIETLSGVLEKFKNGMESLFYVATEFEDLEMVEVAAEVFEEETTLTSPSERESSTGCYKRRDLVSVSTFKFQKLEFQQQSEGFLSSTKIQIADISVEDCTSIPWDEFQTKFRVRSKDWVEVPIDAGLRPKVKIRMNHLMKLDPKIFQSYATLDRNHLLDAFEDLATVRVESINLKLNASSAYGLVDLLEEEITPAPFPATIFLKDIKLRIVEDRPVCNITSPEPVPVDIVISHLKINRLASGVIEIESYNKEAEKVSPDSDSADKSPSNSNLQFENEELRRRLAVLEGLAEENYRLKKFQQEAEKMRCQLHGAFKNINLLLQNKESLLDRISALENKFRLEQNSKR